MLNGTQAALAFTVDYSTDLPGPCSLNSLNMPDLAGGGGEGDACLSFQVGM